MLILKDDVFQLTKSPKKVAKIINQVVQAADPFQAVQNSLRFDGKLLFFNNTIYDVDNYERIFVLGVGKASLEMSRAILEKIVNRIHKVLIVTKIIPDALPDTLLGKSTEIISGDHPIPGQSSLLAGRKIREFISGINSRDLVICLISGGGSALICAPVDGISLEDLQRLSNALLRCGASIQEINTVRKHLDELKGGGLARLVYPARIVSLIISDVVGDQIDTIASGMTAADSTTYSDAMKILEKYQLSSEIDKSILSVLTEGIQGKRIETLKMDDPIVHNINNQIILTNQNLQETAVRIAKNEGFLVQKIDDYLQGSATEIGRKTCLSFLELLMYRSRPFLLVGGGETTVEVKGNGMGGRNLEMALSAVPILENIPNSAMVTLATDGEDGTTNAAGAIVTNKTMAKAKELNILPEAFLSDHDSFSFFQKVGGLIKTGSTGTNVNDLVFFFAF